jgi:hypothetical protein
MNKPWENSLTSNNGTQFTLRACRT